MERERILKRGCLSFLRKNPKAYTPSECYNKVKYLLLKADLRKIRSGLNLTTDMVEELRSQLPTKEEVEDSLSSLTNQNLIYSYEKGKTLVFWHPFENLSSEVKENLLGAAYEAIIYLSLSRDLVKPEEIVYQPRGFLVDGISFVGHIPDFLLTKSDPHLVLPLTHCNAPNDAHNKYYETLAESAEIFSFGYLAFKSNHNCQVVIGKEKLIKIDNPLQFIIGIHGEKNGFKAYQIEAFRVLFDDIIPLWDNEHERETIGNIFMRNRITKSKITPRSTLLKNFEGDLESEMVDYYWRFIERINKVMTNYLK